ncbi:hypothetical protein ACFVHB_29580 [Kitasatospora sp. NPDC127111]|uniref:hypothetical protein n=1 Tax=Kitasatospora sp. NPDC127111 TaxID=3345363 RepID=UPI00363BAFB2
MSRISKARIAAAATVAVLTAATPLMLASTAEAAPGGTAPACITRDVNAATHSVKLGNYCGKVMSVTVVLKDGSTTPCFTMSNNFSFTVRYGSKTYARTAVC